MAASDFLADQVVVFRTGGQGRIRTLLAENLREGAGRALALAESYASRHWAQDPNRHLLLPPVAGEERRGVVLRAVRVEEIADAEYRAGHSGHLGYFLALLRQFHSSLCRTMVSRHLGHRSRTAPAS